VCEPGTVKVHNFFEVERYSHVMHLVSTVTGRWPRAATRSTRSRRASPPARCPGRRKAARDGDHRALEPTRRGLYGGIVGYLDFAGDADTAIAIRTALVRDGVATCRRAAASSPTTTRSRRTPESLNKARAVLSR